MYWVIWVVLVPLLAALVYVLWTNYKAMARVRFYVA